MIQSNPNNDVKTSCLAGWLDFGQNSVSWFATRSLGIIAEDEVYLRKPQANGQFVQLIPQINQCDESKAVSN